MKMLKPTPSAGRKGLAVLLALAASVWSSHAAEVTAKRTDDFVDSMGINIKFNRGAYDNNVQVVKDRLEELGIWHYRDGLNNVNDSGTYRSYYQDLYDDLGYKGLFIWGPWENQGRTGPQAVGAAKKGLDYIAYISGPNEPDLFWSSNYDNDSSTNFWEEVFNYQNSMYDALKADPLTASIPVTTPPFSHYSEHQYLGNVGYVKADNIAWHWYGGQGHPDKPEVSTAVAAVRNGINSGEFDNGEMLTTESGHNSWKTAKPGNSNPNAVSERAQMRYNIRILADQFRRGIKRTYLHQLLDLGNDPNNYNDAWGIVRLDANRTPKPAFTAWAEMVDLFRERTWNASTKTWSIPNFTPGSLDYTITGNTNAVRDLLLQKSDGTFYLLVWVARPSWDIPNDTDTTVSRDIDLNFVEPFPGLKRYQFNDGTGAMEEKSITANVDNTTWSFKAQDSLSIVEIPSTLAGNFGVKLNTGGGTVVGWSDETGGNTFSTTSSINTSASGTAPEGVYQSEVWGDPFGYTFAGLEANEHYNVRLHFAEIFATSAGSRVFDAQLNGATVVDNLDIFARVGKDFGFMRSFSAKADANGEIDVDFAASVDNAKISGIEVLDTEGVLRIEAEHYDAASDNESGNVGTAGVFSGPADIEATSDAGGGYNVGWTKSGEWLDYNLGHLPNGVYDINLRLASANSGRSVGVSFNGGASVGSVNAPSNGWQSFETKTIAGVSLGGNTTMRVSIIDDGMNLNWIELVPVISDVGSDIDAAEFDADSDADRNADPVTDESTHIGFIPYRTSNYTWVRYNSWDFSSGASSFTVTAATGTKGGTLELVVDSDNDPAGGTVIGSVAIRSSSDVSGGSGGWSDYKSFTTNSITGEVNGNLFLVFKAAAFSDSSKNYLFDVATIRFD